MGYDPKTRWYRVRYTDGDEEEIYRKDVVKAAAAHAAAGAGRSGAGAGAGGAAGAVGRERHMFWPCQHARACGDCAARIWYGLAHVARHVIDTHILPLYLELNGIPRLGEQHLPVQSLATS